MAKKTHKIPIKQPPRRWHYTIATRLPAIIEGRVILLATTGIGERESPAVWTSTNQVWEETANKMYIDPKGCLNRGTRHTTARFYGLARIEVLPDAAPHDWLAFRRLSGVRPETAGGLAKTGKAQGADPHAWFVSFDPIGEEDWLAVEVWNGTTWIPHSGWKRPEVRSA